MKRHLAVTIGALVLAAVARADVSLQIVPQEINSALAADGWMGLQVSLLSTGSDTITALDLHNIISGISYSGSPGITGEIHQSWDIRNPFKPGSLTATPMGSLASDPTERTDSFFMNADRYLLTPNAFHEDSVNPSILSGAQDSISNVHYGVGSSMTFSGAIAFQNSMPSLDLAFVIVRASSVASIHGVVLNSSNEMFVLDNALTAGTFVLSKPNFASAPVEPPSTPVVVATPPVDPAPAPIVVANPPVEPPVIPVAPVTPVIPIASPPSNPEPVVVAPPADKELAPVEAAPQNPEPVVVPPVAEVSVPPMETTVTPPIETAEPVPPADSTSPSISEPASDPVVVVDSNPAADAPPSDADPTVGVISIDDPVSISDPICILQPVHLEFDGNPVSVIFWDHIYSVGPNGYAMGMAVNTPNDGLFAAAFLSPDVSIPEPATGVLLAFPVLAALKRRKICHKSR